ncbi:MAG: hypothetical protein ACP5MW_04735 [Thermoplasmata archaeon]
MKKNANEIITIVLAIKSVTGINKENSTSIMKKKAEIITNKKIMLI